MFKPFPKGLRFSEDLNDQFDWTQIFVKNKAEFDALLPKVLKAMVAESRLWVSYPKSSSKMQSDLTRDKGWEGLRGVDLKWINLISVNDTWSAFALRTYKPGEEGQAIPWSS